MFCNIYITNIVSKPMQPSTLICCIFQSKCPATADTIGKHAELLFWDPIKVQDIMWNFEKFLIGPDGHPVRRYHHSVDPSEIASDIEELLPSTT